jgi:hypothetical protein
LCSTSERRHKHCARPLWKTDLWSGCLRHMLLLLLQIWFPAAPCCGTLHCSLAASAKLIGFSKHRGPSHNSTTREVLLKSMTGSVATLRLSGHVEFRHQSAVLLHVINAHWHPRLRCDKASLFALGSSAHGLAPGWARILRCWPGHNTGLWACELATLALHSGLAHDCLLHPYLGLKLHMCLMQCGMPSTDHTVIFRGYPACTFSA